MVHQGEGEKGRSDPAAAFARLWSGIVSNNPELQRVDLTPPSKTAPVIGNRTPPDDNFNEKAREAHKWLHGQRNLLPLPPLHQQRYMGAAIGEEHWNVAAQPVLGEQGKSASAIDAMNAALSNSLNPPSGLGYKLNEEDLALAEACLDGLAEEDGPGRSLRREQEAAAKAVQRLGVDSTNEGAHLLLSLLVPMGLGGDNISPAQMKALLEAMGSSPGKLHRCSPESLREMLREQLLGEVPSPRAPERAERSDLWPEGSRQAPSGGCPTSLPPWDVSRHQVSPARPRSLFARDIMPSSTSLTSSASMPNCDVLANSSLRANSQQSFQSHSKSPRKKVVSLPELDSVFSCKTLKTRERKLETTGWRSSSIAAAASRSFYFSNRSKKHPRPAKIRYGDRRLPPILVEVR